MPDYEKMYFQLAAMVADAVDTLVEAQQQGENTYAENEIQSKPPLNAVLSEGDSIQRHD